jgi:hypothetical protein
VRETVLPDTYSTEAGPERLRRLLHTLVDNRPGWTLRGPVDVPDAHPRWDLYDKDGIWMSSYQLVTPRHW